MSISQVYTAIPNDVISAARWNNEFGNIYNNGTSLAFPLTHAVSLAGYTVSLDSLGTSQFLSTAGTAFYLSPGNKSGVPGTLGSAVTVATHTFTDTNTAGSGTAATYTSFSIAGSTVAAANTLVTVTNAASLYLAGPPVAGTNVTLTHAYSMWVASGAIRTDAGVAGTVAPGKHIDGLIVANNTGDATNDIDITVGSATSVKATITDREVLFLNTAITKRLDASWATGTNQGGLSSSLAIANTDYWVHIIRVAGVDDIGFDTSATAANLITDHAATAYRPIGWIRRTGGVIVQFNAVETAGGGLHYAWEVPTLDISLAATLTTSRRLDVIRVPLGIKVKAFVTVEILDAAAFTARICDPDETDAAPATTTAPLANVKGPNAGQYEGAQLVLRTDTSGQLAARATTSTIDQYNLTTDAFEWSRR